MLIAEIVLKALNAAFREPNMQSKGYVAKKNMNFLDAHNNSEQHGANIAAVGDG